VVCRSRALPIQGARPLKSSLLGGPAVRTRQPALGSGCRIAWKPEASRGGAGRESPRPTRLLPLAQSGSERRPAWNARPFSDPRFRAEEAGGGVSEEEGCPALSANFRVRGVAVGVTDSAAPCRHRCREPRNSMQSIGAPGMKAPGVWWEADDRHNRDQSYLP